MNDIGKLKKQIILYGALVSVVCEGVSFIVLGWNLHFLIGLAGGFIAATVNFNILAFTLTQMLKSGNSGLSSLGFFFRMMIYCIVFYFCVKTSYIMGAACVIGFLALKIPMYYLHAIKPKFNTNRKVSPEVQAIYDEEDKLEEDKFYGREED